MLNTEFYHLPQEMHREILCRVWPEDLINLTEVSKVFRDILCDSEVYKNSLKIHFKRRVNNDASPFHLKLKFAYCLKYVHLMTKAYFSQCLSDANQELVKIIRYHLTPEETRSCISFKTLPQITNETFAIIQSKIYEILRSNDALGINNLFKLGLTDHQKLQVTGEQIFYGYKFATNISPLEYAVRKGHMGVAKMILNWGTHRFAKCDALLAAIPDKNIKFCNLMFQRGLDPYTYSSAFHLALRDNCIDALKGAIRKYIPKKALQMELTLTIANPFDANIAEFVKLIAKRIHLRKSAGTNIKSMLRIQSMSAPTKMELIRILSADGIDLQTETATRAFCYAATLENEDVLRIMLAKGGLGKEKICLEAVIKIAELPRISESHFRILKFLCRLIDPKDPKAESAFMTAQISGHKQVEDLLSYWLKKKFNPERFRDTHFFEYEICESIDCEKAHASLGPFL